MWHIGFLQKSYKICLHSVSLAMIEAIFNRRNNFSDLNSLEVSKFHLKFYSKLLFSQFNISSQVLYN